MSSLSPETATAPKTSETEVKMDSLSSAPGEINSHMEVEENDAHEDAGDLAVASNLPREMNLFARELSWEPIESTSVFQCLLTNENMTEAVEKWVFSWNDSDRALEDLIMMMVRAGGRFTYLPPIPPDTDELKRLVTQQAPDDSPPSLCTVFLEQFSEFMKQLFLFDNGRFLFNRIFAHGVLDVIFELRASRWLSHGIMGASTGLYMMSAVREITIAYRQQYTETPTSLILGPRLDELKKIWDLLFTKHLTSILKSKFVAIRNLGYVEMEKWAEADPIMFFEQEWRFWLRWAIVDNCCKTKKSGCKILFSLFGQNLSQAPQKSLMEFLKKAILSYLKLDGHHRLVALRVFLTGTQSLNVKFNNDDKDQIIDCIFTSRYYSVMACSAHFILVNVLSPSGMGQSTGLIRGFILLVNQFPSHVKRLLEAFLHILVNWTSWEDWDEAIGTSGNQEMAAICFYYFVLLLNTPGSGSCYTETYIRKIRAQHEEKIRGFTAHFEYTLLSKVTDPRVQSKTKVLTYLLKTVCFLKGLGTSVAMKYTKLAVEMMQKVEDSALNSALWDVYTAMKPAASNDSSHSLLVQHLTESVTQAFAEWTAYPLVSPSNSFYNAAKMAQFQDFNDESLWNVCNESLSQALIQVNERSANNVVRVMTVMSNMITKRFNYVVEQTKLDDEYLLELDDLTLVLNRALVLRSLVGKFLGKGLMMDLSDQAEVFRICCTLQQELGVHWQNHVVFASWAGLDVKKDLLTLLHSIWLLSKDFAPDHNEACCSVFQHFSKLIATGCILPTEITPIFVLIGEQKSHDRMLLGGLQALIKKAPDFSRQIASSIASGLAVALADNIRDGIPHQTAISELNKRIEKWTSNTTFRNLVTPKMGLYIHEMIVQFVKQCPSAHRVVQLFTALHPFLDKKDFSKVVQMLVGLGPSFPSNTLQKYRSVVENSI